MTSLILAELRRYSKRTLFMVGIIGIIGIQVTLLVNAYVSSRPPTAAQVAEAQPWMDEQQKWNEEYYGPDGDCLREQELNGGSNEDWGCLDVPPPVTVDTYFTRATYEDLAVGAFPAMASFFAIFSFIAGVSFITAEFSSGSISNWLTFEPRRMRVFFSKLSALLIATGVIGAINLSVSALALRFISAINGSLGDDPGKIDRIVLQEGGRWLLGALMAVAIGFAIGTLLRSASLAGGVTVLFIIIDLMATNMARDFWRITVTPRLQAWFMGDYMYINYDECYTANAMGQECTPIEHHLTQAQGGWYLLACAAVIVTAALLVFRRRDAA
ncbi:hypothetical protein GCM10010401_13480 [Rarobacter faecitabidus]|uniref:ABC-2 type transport system permease protein n=1 Tax=Rarobacter faecitabidus TaxID=13243 RepID=A0A542ZE33_RARFA|nr:ABC transporter permease subunit [Rarobacter faecitabidus]TQL58604.1 ABC-2 type transport system permease protein [Rarobacter faecitabidus]